MYFQLTKSEKKQARMIMDKGLENEYQEGLKFAATILDTWREGEISTKDAYMKLIQGLEDRSSNQ